MDKSKAPWKKLEIANIADRTQYYFAKFKNMKYQPCRIFIENTFAVGITMSSLKTEAAIFKS